MFYSLSFPFSSINNFGVSATILLGGASSGQTSIICCDLAWDVQPPPLKNYKDLTTKLEVKYLFPTLSSDANFYIYQLPEGLGMRKILAHGISRVGCKRIPKTGQTFSGFSWIFKELSVPKAQLAPSHKKAVNDVANPKIVMFICLALDQKHLFWVNTNQKMTTVFRVKLDAKIIQICRI